MVSSKIFAGSRLRRLRSRLGLSQAAFAQSLGLSASYLNLMERDQRPLTAQVVLKLSTMEGVDITELAPSEAAHALLPQLREMLAEPLLQGEVPPGNEINEALQTAPNFAAATLKLYSAYREALRKLADAARGIPPTANSENTGDWINARNNDDLEGLAEDIWSELSPKDDIFSGLKARLRANFGIDTRLMPTTIMGADRSRYDRHSQRLLISEALGFESRIEEAAHLTARLEGKALGDAATTQREAKAAMYDHLALAIRCPRGRFTTSAEDLKYDIAALARRFSVTQGQAMQRLAIISDNAAYLSVFNNGQLASRAGRMNLFTPQHDSLCAQLPLFDEAQGLHIAEMQPQDGEPRVVIGLREHNRAHALFFTPSAFAKTAYAPIQKQRPWGAACRLCEIRNCARRTAAAAARPAGLNDYIRGATGFEPV